MSGSLLDLGGHANADESVVGLELLHGLVGVVDEGEAGALATTELGAETEDRDLLLGSLVQLGELLAELILGDVGAVGVKDVTVRESDCQQTNFRAANDAGDDPRDGAGRESMGATRNGAVCPQTCTSYSSSSSSPKGGGEGDSHDHLLAGKQWVADELARAQGDLALRHLVGGGRGNERGVASWEVEANVAVVDREIRKRRTDVRAAPRLRAKLQCRGGSSASIAWWTY